MEYWIGVRGSASELERFAAHELQRYMDRLFGISAPVREWAPAASGSGMGMGAGMGSGAGTGAGEDVAQPHTLWLARTLDADGVAADRGEMSRAPHGPALTAQGYMLHSTDERTLRLSGGSPSSLLWAVYELAETWGVVHTLQGDVFPERPAGELIPRLSRICEPRQQLRSWRLMSELIFGPVGWPLSRQLEVIGQLAKQRYNGIFLSLWPHQPFIDFGVDGISRTFAGINCGEIVPLTPDNIGRDLLPPGEAFVNPDFAHCRTFEEWHEAGVRYLRSVIRRAKFYGMRVCVSFQPFDLPREFAGLLEKPVPVRQSGMLTVAEGGNQLNDAHVRLLEAQFAAYLDTYGEADEFEICLSEHARNMDLFEAAWSELDAKFQLSAKHDLHEALYDEATGAVAAGGTERSANEGKMTLVMLHTLHGILEKTGYLAMLRARNKSLSIKLGLSCPALLPVVADALWEGACMRIQTGYTSSRAVRNLRVLNRLHASERVRIEQIITLQDDNVGAFPQLCASSIARLVEYGCERGWHGYVTRFWMTGDLDPLSSCLMNASWNKSAWADNAYRAFAVSAFGTGAAHPAALAFRLVEDATLLLDIELSIMLPLSGAMTNKIGAGRQAMPEMLWHALNLYAEARQLFGQAAGCAQGDAARRQLAYWSARLQFGIFVLQGMGKLQTGNDHLLAGDAEAARRSYRAATDEFRHALASMAECARDDSDKAALAVHYHLLVREVGRFIGQLIPATQGSDP